MDTKKLIVAIKKKKVPKTRSVTLRIPDNQYTAIKSFCVSNGVTVTDVIKQAVSAVLRGEE